MKYFQLAWINYPSYNGSIGDGRTVNVKITKAKSRLQLVRKLKKQNRGQIHKVEKHSKYFTTVWLKTPEPEIAHKTIEVREGLYPENDEMNDFELLETVN